MFRRRRRDGEDSTEREPGEESYPAAGDELAEDEPAGHEPAGHELAGHELAGHELAGQELVGHELAGHELAEENFAEDYPPEDGYAPVDEVEEVGGADYEVVEDERANRPERADLGDPVTWTRLRDTQPTTSAMARSSGPWDSASSYPEAERIDFGSLLIPVREGYDLQALISEEEGISIIVVRADSGLQLLPFAAPRSSGLWHEVLPEIAEEVKKAGGHSTEQAGPFGPEILATVSPQPQGEFPAPPQELRFMGADGPRWFLRGLISGPAATDRELARPFEEIFADIVVVRGDHALPQRQALEIRLPQEAQEVFEQAAAQDPNLLNPFERGPEITETR